MTTIADLVNTAPDPTFGIELANWPADPGGGTWRWVVEVADPLAGTYVEFYDVTQFYLSDHLERGADEYVGKYRGAVVQVQLQITPRQADDLGTHSDILAPWGEDTTVLFGEDVPLGAGLIMRAGVILVEGGVVVGSGAIGTGWFPTWTGTVETWGDSTHARGQNRIHTISVIDTLSSLVGVPVPSFGGTNPWEERFDDILGFADWRYGADLYGEDGLTTMPVRAEQADALVELDAVADPTGLVFRSRRNGRMVVHPAPWDTTHTAPDDVYPNPLLALFSEGLAFSYNPGVGDIDYIVDDAFPSFGVEDTSKGVINSFAFDMAGSPYLIDDPTSVDLHGIKHRAVAWIIDNEPAADQLLLRRANATKQALPLMTSIDHQGFWPAMGLVDHLDPIEVIHNTYETGPVLTTTGTVRRIVEDRVLRHATGLTWVSTIQLDITATTVEASLLPVEDLAIDSLSSHEAEFTWTNPSQVITPTDTQLRIVGFSNVWIDWPYPMTFYQTPLLAPTTNYEFEVRLVKKVNGVITNFSPVRSINFTTLTPTIPVIIPDPDDPTDTDIEIPVDEECLIEWVIEENDGTGWTTFMSGDQDDLVFNPVTGQWNLPTPIDNEDFDPAKLYRVGYREDCGEGFGDWIYGAEEDPPDDWTDPCPEPPVLSEAPYDDADLIVFVPVLCPTEEA